MQFYHSKECPNLDTSFFKEDSNKIKLIPKTIIVTGGSRNGNHLVWSLLDGNSKLPYIAGEDRLLSQIFIQNLNNKKKFLKDLKNNKSNFLRRMSGINFDKWRTLNLKKFNIHKWAGKHKASYIPILEFPNLIQEVNYNKYRKCLTNGFKKLKKINFYQIFSLYLNAVNKLSPHKKNNIFRFSYAQSGLRREILYLLDHKANFKFLVPIRKFETFYFSKIKGLYNSTQIKTKYIKEAWEHWYHKTNDYLYLKKKFPNNIILIQFEDLENILKRKKTLKKILKKIGIKFEEINLKPTVFKAKVIPNSSFFVKRKKTIYLDEFKTKLFFPQKKIPKKYFSILKEVKKLSY